MDLVVMAAGLGSRFGGLKQLEPMDEFGDFIIDYSVFDAIRSHFNKIIFIIRKENETIFKNTIGNRIKSKIPVEYVFQEIDAIPNDNIPLQRSKPLGTGHAILCCKKKVEDPFLMINADDFYGQESFKIASEFAKTECNDHTFGCIAYDAGKTITENGTVKRGICKTNNGNITEIIESSICKNSNDKINATPLDMKDTFETDLDTPVSMNMFILHPSIFNELDKGFKEFIENMNDPMKDEYLIPDIISTLINNKKISLRLLRSPETWYGVTYKEDKESVVRALKTMRMNGTYPLKLWD